MFKFEEEFVQSMRFDTLFANTLFLCSCILTLNFCILLERTLLPLFIKHISILSITLFMYNYFEFQFVTYASRWMETCRMFRSICLVLI